MRHQKFGMTYASSSLKLEGPRASGSNGVTTSVWPSRTATEARLFSGAASPYASTRRWSSMPVRCLDRFTVWHGALGG